MEYSHFVKQLSSIVDLNLLDYKSKQMRRRLDSLMRRVGVTDHRAYLELLKGDSAELERLLDFLTINVSDFFRNPEKFAYLQEVVIPDLLAREKGLKIWSAGCSIGLEPYSMNIMLTEMGQQAGRHSILATDLDDRALNRARQATYRVSEVKGINPARLNRFFSQQEDLLVLDDVVRDGISFKKHNLLQDPYPSGFDLVICRNVLIYFTDKAKARVIGGLARSLRPGGVLFVGSTETIFDVDSHGLQVIAPFFYRRVISNTGERMNTL